MIFQDRQEAGKLLAEKLRQYQNKKQAIILAIPRGGLEIGAVLAERLNLPLEVILTKKLGFPGKPEYALGAVSLQSEFIDPLYLHQLPPKSDFFDNPFPEIFWKIPSYGDRFHQLATYIWV
mgnify:CR=1 FL=1